MNSYNLAQERWIRVRFRDGTVESVGFRELLHRADEIETILGDLPTQTFALLRCVLAILIRVLDGPPTTDDWRDLWNADSLPSQRIDSYFEEWGEAFDLFHAENPFMQVRELRTSKGETLPIAKLIADVPDGHQYFTVRGGAGLDVISPAEAARWLVHTHAFDPSGIKSGAVDDPRVKGGKGYPIGTGWAGNLGGLYWEGSCLRETLLLNLIPRDCQHLLEWRADDRPAWEAPNATGAEAADVAVRPYGPADIFTWQSRRIRLVGDAQGVTGVVVCNGDKMEPFNKHRSEPMSAWRSSPAQAKKRGLPSVYMPQLHDPARALWRGLGSLLPVAAPIEGGGQHMTPAIVDWVREEFDDERFQLRAVGVIYGTQNSTIKDVYDDRLTVPMAVLSELHSDLATAVLDALDATERHGVWALRRLAANLALAAGADTAGLIDGRSDRAAERAYVALDPVFRAWLAGLTTDSSAEDALSDYYTKARQILLDLGSELTATAGPHAIVGRDVATRRVSAPLAEAWFRAAIWKAFPTDEQDGGE